jgi:uncharacterized protein YjiS (DUF1127 family)
MSQSYSIKGPVRAGPVTSAGQAVLSSLASMIAIWLNRQQGRRDLSELDDRLLADVGISQEDALWEARKPFWRGKHAHWKAGEPLWRA